MSHAFRTSQPPEVFCTPSHRVPEELAKSISPIAREVVCHLPYPWFENAQRQCLSWIWAASNNAVTQTWGSIHGESAKRIDAIDLYVLLCRAHASNTLLSSGGDNSCCCSRSSKPLGSEPYWALRTGTTTKRLFRRAFGWMLLWCTSPAGGREGSLQHPRRMLLLRFWSCKSMPEPCRHVRRV